MEVTNILKTQEVRDFLSQDTIHVLTYYHNWLYPAMPLYCPLLLAVKEGKADFVTTLLKFGANVNCTGKLDDTFSGTALLLAVKLENTEMVKQLVHSGADPNKKGTMKENAMYLKELAKWNSQVEYLSPLELARKNHLKECIRIMQDFQGKTKAAEENAEDIKMVNLKASTKFVQNLSTRKDLHFLSDVEIICRTRSNETSFPSHRFVLASSSQIFLNMFEDEDSEASKSGKIIVKDICAIVMAKFLEFLYLGELKNMYLEDAEELLKVAERYKVTELKETCEKEIMKEMSVSNCARLLHLAKKVGAKRLEAKAFHYVQDNLEVVAPSKDYVMLMNDFPDAMLNMRLRENSTHRKFHPQERPQKDTFTPPDIGFTMASPGIVEHGRKLLLGYLTKKISSAPIMASAPMGCAVPGRTFFSGR